MRRRPIYTLLALVLILAAIGLALLLSRTNYFSKTVLLNGVAFPDTSHGWMVGGKQDSQGAFEGGVVFATTNGGATWRQQTSTSAIDPSAVAFANPRDGWVVGSPETNNTDTIILATTNGGATWKQQNTGTKDDFEDVAFANAKDGWAVGGEGIIATTNGGASWKTQYSATGNEDFNSVACADATHAWAVGQGFIVATTNGGANWKVQYSGWIKSYSLINDIEAVACANANDAWAVGMGARGRGLILATTNGGTTWKVQHTSAGPQPLSAVSFANNSDGWVVGGDPDQGTSIILRTTNGGHTWQAQRSGSSACLDDVACVSPSRGWVVGSHWKTTMTAPIFVGESIFSTTDGGRTWRH